MELLSWNTEEPDRLAMTGAAQVGPE